MITVGYIGENISNLLIEQIREENNINLTGLNPYKSDILGIMDGLKLDAIILSLHTPVNLIRQIKNHNPKIKIIVAVNNSNPATYFELLKENVDYLLDNNAISANILVDAILSVGQQNYFPIPSNLVKPFMKKLEELKLDNYDIFSKRLVENGVQLSIKEAEVAYYVRKNMRNKQIAELLHITEGTVKVHISKIYKKINTKGRINMVYFFNRIMSNGQENGGSSNLFGL